MLRINRLQPCLHRKLQFNAVAIFPLPPNLRETPGRSRLAFSVHRYRSPLRPRRNPQDSPQIWPASRLSLQTVRANRRDIRSFASARSALRPASIAAVDGMYRFTYTPCASRKYVLMPIIRRHLRHRPRAARPAMLVINLASLEVVVRVVKRPPVAFERQRSRAPCCTSRAPCCRRSGSRGSRAAGSASA